MSNVHEESLRLAKLWLNNVDKEEFLTEYNSLKSETGPLISNYFEQAYKAQLKKKCLLNYWESLTLNLENTACYVHKFNSLTHLSVRGAKDDNQWQINSFLFDDHIKTNTFIDDPDKEPTNICSANDDNYALAA